MVQGGHFLYTYILSPNDVLSAGLKSPVLIPAEMLGHYAGRAESHEKQEIVRYLESIFPGRSRAVSFLTERVPETKNRKIKGFAERRQCFMCHSGLLEQCGAVEAVYCCDGGCISRLNDWAEIDFSALAWDTVREDDGIFFQRIRHYMLVLKKGRLPSEYILKA